MPPTNVFPDQPPANTVWISANISLCSSSLSKVYMTDAPPPYPGINGTQGYSSGGAGGWTTSNQRKEAEAAASAPVQNGYYDSNDSSVAYVPPPAYNDLPPAYQQGEQDKKNK